MNRRDFILKTGAAAASGIIPVRFYENCVEWLNNHGKPLIVPPPEPRFEIHARPDGGGVFQLHLGPPDTEIPKITWREFFENYEPLDLENISREELEDEYGYCVESLDDECPGEIYEDAWVLGDSSNALAYHYLRDLDLGPGFVRDGHSVGSLQFIQGPVPGSNYTAVHAEDEISLSCLQERLNQLGENVKIVLAEE